MPLDNTPPLPSHRRSLLRNAGLGAAALGALAIGAKSQPAFATTDPSITDVLNFALNLEYLEAEFYLRATTGKGIPSQYTTGSGMQGGVTWGGSQVPFHSPRIRAIAQDIASDEFSHVQALRATITALGGSPVAEPNINLLNSFTTLARAAGIVGPTGTFDPFASDDAFLVGAFIFEDVGVTAYHGAAGYLTSNLDVLSAAAGILAVEAYHGGAIRASMIERPSSVAQIANKVTVLRGKLSAAVAPNTRDEQPVLQGMTANIAPADSNAIAFSRTPGQVLNIVYGGGAASNYLFFPSKLNGAIS